MSEKKFDKRYFELNYNIKENTVYRNEDSSGESQGIKEQCLRACLTYFLDEDLTGTKKISDHFASNNLKRRTGGITRCCCSQYEETWITHLIVTHKSTKLNFIVGKDCFLKMFSQADDADTFFKETCKYCEEIVAKRNDERPNFCNQKCVKKYEEQEKRRAEYAKRVALPSPAPQKVYENCAECDKPKYTEKQRKCRLCFDCNQALIGERTPFTINPLGALCSELRSIL